MTQESTRRCFVAVKVSPQVSPGLQDTQTAIRKHLPEDTALACEPRPTINLERSQTQTDKTTA